MMNVFRARGVLKLMNLTYNIPNLLICPSVYLSHLSESPHRLSLHMFLINELVFNLGMYFDKMCSLLTLGKSCLLATKKL